MTPRRLLLLVLLLTSSRVMAQTSPHGPLSLQCAACHTTDSWTMRSDASFDHAGTGFQLLGQHKTVGCSTCHAGLKFSGTESACTACHTDIHRSELGTDCQRCHTNQSWLVADIVQRHQQTQFPLVGVHASVACQSCHVPSRAMQYAGTPTTCVGCHHNDFSSTRNPSHTTAGFSSDCMECHSPTATSWGTGFDHQRTTFPLTGSHIAVSCSGCHANNIFRGTTHDCYVCHTSEYTTTADPNHSGGGFSHTCTECHTTAGWRPSSFSHDNSTFPLVGAHKAVICSSCHVNNVFAGLPTECVPCHQTDYAGVASPGHTTGMFPLQCLTCHSMNGWTPSVFDHASTGFPLTGRHTTVDCGLCHTNGNYQLAYSTCYQCHQSDYQATQDPNHVALSFSQDCQTCHSTAGWSGALFDHATTAFPLTGHHATQDCRSCHVNSNFHLTYQGCYSCHQAAYTQTINPNHVALSFSQQCESCHSTSGWSGAVFDHASTGFPLTGHHTTQECQSCHVNNNYQLSYQGCYACHQGAYAQTTNPNHSSLAFSQQCESCHSTSSWTPASFDHSQTAFSLTGAHRSTSCTNCHVNGDYQISYQDCYQCHQSEYQQPTNPNHTTLVFSHRCESCHTTSAWTPSTFNHDTQFFRINSGEHRGRWQSCSQCHPSVGDFVTFTCLSCHEHNKTEMDGHHNGIAGYIYASPNCYSCHRNV